MIPTVDSLVGLVQAVIDNPKRTLIEKAVSTAADESAGVVIQSMKASPLLQQKISDFKYRHVVNSDDIATACAVVDILFSSVLQIRVRGTALSKASADDRSVPATFLVGQIFHDNRAAKVEDESLHTNIKRLTDARSAFSEVFPLCIGAIAGKEYLDLKEIGKSFTSLVAADVFMVKEGLKTCERGVEICNKGLRLAALYDKDISEWLRGAAHET